MTKGELIRAMEPFDDEIQIVNSDGEGFLEAQYMTDDDFKGFIVLIGTRTPKRKLNHT